MEKLKKINVLQVSNQLGIGGTEKTLQTFSEYLNKDLFNVSVCGIYDGRIREKILKTKGFTTKVIHGNREKFERLLINQKINVVHVHRAGNHEGFVIDVAKKVGIPAIVETNVFGLYDTSQVSKAIDIHLLVSKTTALKYMKKGGIMMNDFSRNCRVLYNPVDFGKFEINKLSEKEKKILKLEIGVPENAPIICRVGRPDMAKWDKFSVEMMRFLIRKLPEIVFLVVGGIPDPIKRKINKLKIDKKFFDLGVVSEKSLMNIYQIIDVYTHCSRMGESFGCTIAEAMAAGKPVVVNSTPWADNAQIELVDNGLTGFVANSPRTYADSIAFLIENKKERITLGLAGLEKIKKVCDPRKIAITLGNIYLRILLNKGIKIDKKLIANYESMQNMNLYYDFQNYPSEYKKRLTDVFGRQSIIEILSFNLKRYTRHLDKIGKISFY